MKRRSREGESEERRREAGKDMSVKIRKQWAKACVWETVFERNSDFFMHKRNKEKMPVKRDAKLPSYSLSPLSLLLSFSALLQPQQLLHDSDPDSQLLHLLSADFTILQ